MKRRFVILIALLTAASMLLSAEELTFTANGVTFKMIRVEGGTFTMGATDEQEVAAEDDERPPHQVTLSTYFIGQTEVTQELWEAVMGDNPSRHKGIHKPVHYVSWDQCQRFIEKLRQITGKSFRLPTEAEWEYAARGGNQSMGYKFSGSDKADKVAWFDRKKPEDVAQKLPNELGIYDMSGNVKEWCLDRYWDYSDQAQTNPVSKNGAKCVNRGGSWVYEAAVCRVSYRACSLPDERLYNIGLRLALPDEQQQTEDLFEQSQRQKYSTKPYEQISVPPTESFTVNGVTFTMIGVDGGTFTMGATKEQGKDANDSEKPAHEVTLNSFQIGQTEVTQDLWVAVMGENPSYFKGGNLPVECVCWLLANRFIVKLRELTGRNFRMPTDAEWEYAARGGSKSQHYKYCGSDKVGDVAWYENNTSGRFTPESEFGTHPVAQKKPNELGIYDMSGNVWEWCSDSQYDYDPEPLTNPEVYIGSKKHYMIRGGGWRSKDKDCRVSRRSYAQDEYTVAFMGLRLAL